MAIARNVAVTILPLGERPQYGSPYPEGLAVAGDQFTGDATGGAVAWVLNADPGLLFRLEGFNLSVGNNVNMDGDVIINHRWAGDKAGIAAAVFGTNWLLERFASAAFSTYSMVMGAGAGGDPIAQIRRLPMGQLTGPPGVSQLLMAVNIANNFDTIGYELFVWFTYWRRESISLPGFLSSFLESPVVPTPLKVGA